MIDFQDGGLEYQVYELIAKMCEIGCSDKFPHFKTEEQPNKKWKCELHIPGVDKTACAFGKTEVESINSCAHYMLFILTHDYDKNQYDPEYDDESIFYANISQWFGDIDGNPEYRYYLSETDLCLDSSSSLLRELKKEALEEKMCGSDIERMCNIVTVRFLTKEKKKNYC